MLNIDINQLANEITKCVQEYTDEVSEAIDREVAETADKVLEQVIADAPVRVRGSRGYAKGFKVTQSIVRGKSRMTIWNKKHYRLVHLLEFGHALNSGGRAKSVPHLRRAYEQHAGALEDRIKQIIKNGG